MKRASGGFDLRKYLSEIDPRLLEDPEGRRLLTRLSPLMFSLVYTPHHLRGKETNDEITFSEFHLDLAEYAKQLVKPIGQQPAQLRDAWIAPRGAGKSSWLFLIIPLWAAAHGHRRFIAAFASSATQSMEHLRTFRRELESNQMLRLDFPELCNPSRKSGGSTESDSKSMYLAQSGFVFRAAGIDSANLGLKVGETRPDHIVLDDIEGADGNYTPTMKEHRLATLLSGILPLNLYASVTMAGTVSIPGCIVDDIAAKQRGDEYPSWVDDEKFTPRYYPAIITEDDGTERSLWPEKWPMAWMETIRHTRQFKSQYMNEPGAVDSPFWQGEDFKTRPDPDNGVPEVQLTAMLLSIDPAVTTREKSDFTGLAVVGYSASEKVCLVVDAWQVKLPPGAPMRARVDQILNQYPQIMGVVVEVNQGGDVWTESVLKGLPVKVHSVSNTKPKEVRAASLLMKYQDGKVFHAKKLGHLENQMLTFPHGAHDDMIDAVGTGVTVFLKDDTPKRDTTPRSQSYI